MDHQSLLKKSAERPIVKPQLKTPDGQALSGAQQAQIDQSNQLMTDASQSRKEGDFAAAADRSRKALAIRQPILGDDHYLTVSSRILANTMSLCSQLPAEKQKKMIESDKLFVDAKDKLDKGVYDESLTAAEKAVALREEVLPQNHPEIGMALLRKGRVLVELTRYEEAEPILQRSREIIVAAFGEHHPQTAYVLDRIGWLRLYRPVKDQTRRQQINEAIRDLRQATRILVETVGENREAAESMDNLGTALALAGGYYKALNAKIRALYIRQQVLGKDDKDVAVSMTNLAWLYGRMGQQDEVIPLHKQALAIFEKKLGPDHPFCYLVMQNLIRAYQSLRKIDDVIKLYERLVALDEKQSGHPQPGVGARLTHLGGAYLRGGRIDDALRIFSRANQLAQKLYKNKKQNQARNILLLIVKLCRNHHMFEDGAGYLEQVVKWDKQMGGSSNKIAYAQRLSRLGSFYMNLGRLNEAKKILTQSVERIKKIEGEGSIKVAAPLLNLVEVHEKLNELDEAAQLNEEVIKIGETLLNRKVLGTAYAMMEMGRINVLQGHLAMAKFSLDDAKKTFSLFEKKDPGGAIRIMRELANYHLKNNEPEKAIELLREALQKCRAWSSEGNTAPKEAASVKTLKMLLDATDPHDSNMEKERASWLKEYKSLLESLKKQRALDAEQKAWLKELNP